MDLRGPFRHLEPTFLSGLFDDPVLLLRMRPLGRSLLFDCGQLHHLAKRALKSVSAIFVTHAHMDHFMGLDTFIRNVHVSPRTFDLFGPPGIACRISHKLKGYDWNLSEEFWCSFRVHEVGPEGIERYFLAGPDGFTCRFEVRLPPSEFIYENRYITVRAALGDHKIPVLCFRIEEKAGFSVDEGKLETLGLVRGPWLKELQRRFHAGWPEEGEILVPRRRGASMVEERFCARELYGHIRGESRRESIGYLTDVGFTEENRAMIEALLKGVSLLVCECSYLREEREKARLSCHLCTDDLNQLAERLRPKMLLPMHLSKLYQGRSDELYRQLCLPPGVRLLRLPDHTTPRPLLPAEFPSPEETPNSPHHRDTQNTEET